VVYSEPEFITFGTAFIILFMTYRSARQANSENLATSQKFYDEKETTTTTTTASRFVSAESRKKKKIRLEINGNSNSSSKERDAQFFGM
jgi:hypothetical protein